MKGAGAVPEHSAVMARHNNGRAGKAVQTVEDQNRTLTHALGYRIQMTPLSCTSHDDHELSMDFVLESYVSPALRTTVAWLDF